MGSVTLGETELSLIVPDEPVGGTHVLINNDGDDAVSGAFLGLPELSVVPDTLFQITYESNGNDVVLFGPEVPSDIVLSNASILMSQEAGSTVGVFSTLDDDLDDEHTYSFAAGTGDTDNALFELVGDELRTGFNGAAKAGYQIRVRSTDSFGLPIEESFSVTVTDFEPPSPGTGGASSTGGAPSEGGAPNEGGAPHEGGTAGEDRTESGNDDSGCGCRQAPGALDTNGGLPILGLFLIALGFCTRRNGRSKARAQVLV
jgi:hypothetical protein